MSVQRDKFWMVWCPDGRAPTFKHGSVSSAQREAERLALANPGKDFFVLYSVDGYHKEIESTRIVFLTRRRRNAILAPPNRA
jgi:hypothetical protein